MGVTAALVKELRERTGAGMMECKKALVETAGDIEAAIESMRKSGQAKAAKKAGRIAAEGVVAIGIAGDRKRGVLVEVNCETDFVAKDGNFASFAEAVAARALETGAADAGTLMALPVAEGAATSIEQAREALVTKIGENVQVRRLVRLGDARGDLYSYRHGVRIGVLVELEGGDATLGKDLAMHIAASSPMCVRAAEVPAGVLAKEREIFRVQALDEVRKGGKPESVADKIVEGRVRKFLEGVTLLGQAFVKDPEIAVGALLDRSGAKVLRFARVEVGEGIEKREDNFAAEVMAQVRDS